MLLTIDIYGNVKYSIESINFLFFSVSFVLSQYIRKYFKSELVYMFLKGYSLT